MNRSKVLKLERMAASVPCQVCHKAPADREPPPGWASVFPVSAADRAEIARLGAPAFRRCAGCGGTEFDLARLSGEAKRAIACIVRDSRRGRP